MKRDLELSLLEELQGLKDGGRFFLDDEVASSPVARYVSEARFAEETSCLFRGVPTIGAHASELPEPGSFLTRRIAGLPVLLTRDADGAAHAFLNVCRHRGARLVEDESGCRRAFSCPYHAWTWNSDGTLRAIPHEEPGFPGVDRAAYALKRLPAAERGGLVWILADPDAEAPDFDAHVGPLADDLEWMGMEDHVVVASETLERAANWKLLVEGGLEAYHFKVAHRETIGPHFIDNLSSYAMLGPHMRSVLPRASLASLAGAPREEWSIRDHANVLYSVFPTDQILLLQDHVAWVALEPLSAGRSRLRLATLAPRGKATPDMAGHWKRNHGITATTLAEDFALNESVQAGLATGANETLTFGRYEGALARFNAEVEARLA